jgi:hypothetical protein
MALEQYLQGSYFSVENPLRLLDRWWHRYCHHREVILGGKNLRVEWTERANRVLQARSGPLIIEMQLYFSCVLKKRVLFHESSELKVTNVNDSMKIAFRPIQAAACDPEEFANNYPVGRVLETPAATKMIPSRLCVDFRKGEWEGEFGYKA